MSSSLASLFSEESKKKYQRALKPQEFDAKKKLELDEKGRIKISKKQKINVDSSDEVDDDGWILQLSGRFAHRESYIRTVVKEDCEDLKIVSLKRIIYPFVWLV